MFFCVFLERCATEHPQHSMYQVLALNNAYADDASRLSNNPDPRMLGAQKLLDKLQQNEKTTLILSQMTEMCNGKLHYCNKFYLKCIKTSNAAK